MKGERAISSICDFIDKIKEYHYDKHIILCGDSNVYYSKGNMRYITMMGNRLREKGFNMIISKNVVTKLRPRNFFQNSQSAEKGFEKTTDDTMFIAYPISLQSKVLFDTKKYFIVTQIELFNSETISNEIIYAFEGASVGFEANPEKEWGGINGTNYHKYLLSDHMPIWCDIDGTRVIAANNVSIKGSRGINYNQDKFCKGITLQKLQDINDEILLPYFLDVLKNLISSLLFRENGDYEKNIDEFTAIQQLGDQWEQLKRLATLTL